ncbi:hypothetical protein [Streptomyces sp. NPDC002619]|uniref:hypothetical protein n=1 Tax=Streptomyces sp. NPDC002619 TaxID=3364655 RepID=UPI0036C3CA7E
MAAKPGADELRVRGRLRTLLGESPTVAPTSAAEPTPAPDDWWDRLYADEQPPQEQARHWWQAKSKPEPDEEPEDEDEEEDEDDEEEPARGKRQPRSPPTIPPRRYDNIPPRLRWLIYHSTAAAAGWRIGLVNWATDTAAWYAHGHWTSPTAWVLYGLAVGVVALYRRTRAWLLPIAWTAAIPASSIVVGVLLYGTTA